MIIDNAGTYTLRYTATDDCGKTATVDRELVVAEPVHVYGVEWIEGVSSRFTRTDESALFSDPSPAVNNGTGSSPFDNLMPWSGMQIVEDVEAGTLVSIPKYYYKITKEQVSEEDNRQKYTFQISNKPQEGFQVSPAHSDRGDGVGERDVVYVGRYHCVDNYRSESGGMRLGSVPLDNVRGNIHALGQDVWTYDFATYWTICMLYLVEFADWNSQAMIGHGCSTNGSAENNGVTDNMNYHTGTNAASRDDYGQVQYRHIEGLWSNGYDFCDGITRGSNEKFYAIKNPQHFGDVTYGFELIGIPSGSNTTCISNFVVPSNPDYQYALLPDNTQIGGGGGQDYSSRICDSKYSYSGSYENVLLGGTPVQKEENGLFQFRTNGTSTFANICCRLMKLPSA